jgi:hypothetical protein
LNDGRCLWCDPDFRKGRHRTNDQPTSVAGARSVAYRAGSQKALLAAAFEAAWPGNLSDEEAAFNAGVSLSSEFSKRCGELRQDGIIVQIDGITRIGAAGVPRLVSVFVKEGSSRGVPGITTKESDVRSSDSPVPVPTTDTHGPGYCGRHGCLICESDPWAEDYAGRDE